MLLGAHAEMFRLFKKQTYLMPIRLEGALGFFNTPTATFKTLSHYNNKLPPTINHLPPSQKKKMSYHDKKLR